MIHPAQRTSLRRTWLRLATLVGASLLCGLAFAQKIDDVPPAVQNNTAPNFMYMIDNSLSMNNIVPATPYDPTATYWGACTGAALVSAGTSVDIRIVSGSPRFRYSGGTSGGSTTDHRHSSITGTQQRCFSNTATYGARLLGEPSAPGIYTDSDYSGHFLNWYFGNFGGATTGWINRKLVSTGVVQTRMEIARTSAKSVIDTLPLPGARAAVRVGLSTYLSSSSSAASGGRLLVAMDDFTTTTKAALKASIDTLVPTFKTPLASTLADIARYMATGYVGNVATANSASVDLDALLRLNGTDNSSRNACLSGAPSCTSSASVKPIQFWCQRSSIFAMTDGRPYADRSFDFNTHIRDYDGDCSGVNASSCVSGGAPGSWDRKLLRTYEIEGSDYMDDVAKVLFDVDFRPDLVKPTPVAPAIAAKNNISTYMIGFADPAVQNDPLLINTALQGGGRFIAATDGPSLVDAFQDVISAALAKDASAAAVAVTNAQIVAGSVGYASSFNSGSWYGDLEAYSLDISTGLQTGATQWSARTNLNARSPSSRVIASFNGTAGVAFTTSNGVAFRATAPTLTDGVINYVRGDRTGEGTTYRSRTNLLGDIINAEPVVVNYPSTGATVFQAANDGMLHVFDGRVESSVATRGQELWAYVPRLIHDKLPGLASLSFEHKYLVDGTPATAEITGAGAMTRILVGGLGKGGAGYYALDITTGTAADEAAAASKVKWEFKPANMGYSFGVPLLVNTSAGWKVVVASGYRNDSATDGLGGDGRGRVWVLNPSTGAVEKTFLTPSGFGSSTDSLGLAHLGKLTNVAADSVVRHVYGGDLKGNVWRFDLNAGDGSEPVRIAAVGAPPNSSSYQPITVPPVVGPVAGSASKLFVYFGTGQYFSVDDVPGTTSPNSFATQTQTMYGIADDTSVASPSLPNIRGTNGSVCPVGGGNGDLVCQAATQASPTSPFVATTNAVDLSTKRGFYMDIPITNGRVNTQAALTIKGTLLFVVNQPSNVICNPGGTSYFFQLNAATGGAVARTAGGDTTYFEAGYLLASALSSRVVVVTTGTGTRGLFRLADKTSASREIPETPGGGAALFKRIYKRALN